MSTRSTAAFLAIIAASAPAYAAPTPPAQLCESAIELASAKFALCRLNAESKFTKKNDAEKRTEALAKCSENLTKAFTKAHDKYDPSCAATESSAAFDGYLTQCSDDSTAAAAGAALPDSSTGLLLKTGQLGTYGPGDDGALQKGIALNHVDNGDGTITDTKTGLMWEKKSDDGTIHDKDNTYKWTTSGTTTDGTAFTTFLAGLNAGGGFAGHTDWRMPNRRELESIINLQHGSPAAPQAFSDNLTCGNGSSGNEGCSVTTCSCTYSGAYWSSSTLQFTPENAWVVDFSLGYVYMNDKPQNYRVRAVRGG
jgi:Protein of unknown function (DUF1566)